MRLAHALLPFVALSATGCLDEPDFESAYAAETDLCTPEALPEFAARVDECRARFLADGSCAGILSFHGSLDLEDGISSSRELDRTAFVATNTPSGLVLVSAELAGRAPFFAFELVLGDVGRLVDSGDIQRTLDVARTPMGVAPNLTDDRLTFTFLLEDGAASKDKQFRTGSVTITRQTAQELVGTLETSNLPGDVLSGCFHAFVTETTTQ